MNDDKDYEVGYCKPPIAHRFKPGQSGNPRGRRKDVKSLEEIFTEEMTASIRVTIDGVKKRVVVTRAMAKRFVKMALEGNLKAARFCTEHFDQGLIGFDDGQDSKYLQTLTEQELAQLYTDAISRDNLMHGRKKKRK